MNQTSDSHIEPQDGSAQSPQTHCLVLRHAEILYSHRSSGFTRRFETTAELLAEIQALLGADAMLAIAYSDDQEKVFNKLQKQLVSTTLRWCSWNDAALCGALAGEAGLWLSLDHWIPLAGSCHSSKAACPEEGGQLLGLARLEAHRTIALVQAEYSLDWISRKTEELLTSNLALTSKMRIQRKLSPLLEISQSRMARARAVFGALLELAEHPGPEPASLALVQKLGRNLTDFARNLMGRTRLPEDCSAIWTDGPMDGPLWRAFSAECQKYLPRLKWKTPQYSPMQGLELLMQGEILAAQRRTLIQQPAGLIGTQTAFSEDSWRQLRRNRPQELLQPAK